MKISSKLNELKPTDLNCNVFDVYSYDALSMQDLLCQFFTKINECIKVSNETIDLASWLVNEGLKIEVVNKLMMWLNDGTLENLINVNLFNTLNTKLDNIAKKSYIVRERLEGEVNDNEAIKEAIRNSHKHSTIYFTRDVYISEKIDILDRTIDGGNNTFYCGIHGLDYQFNASGEVKFINCKVNSGLIGRGFVTVSNCDMFIAENLHFTGYSKEFGYYKTDSGIILNSNVKKANIKNCVWNSWGNQYGTATNDLNRCITINETVNDVVVDSCSFIKVNQAVVNDSTCLRLVNNIFEEVNDNAVYSFGENVYIDNNTFKNMNDEVIVISGGNYFISNNTFNNWKNKAIAFCGNVDFINITNNSFLSNYDNSQFIVTRDTSHYIKKIFVDNNIFQSEYLVTNDNDWFRIGSNMEFKFNNNYVNVNQSSSNKKIITLNSTIIHLFNNSFTSQTASTVNVLDNSKEGSIIQHGDNYVSNCRIHIGGNKMGKVQDNVPYYNGVNDNKFVYCNARPTWTSNMKKGDIILNTTVDTDAKNSDIMGWYFNGTTLNVMSMPPIIKEGSPTNVRRPRYIGDLCIDTTNKKLYVAVSTGVDGWVVLN